jgi:hypothetical protein
MKTAMEIMKRLKEAYEYLPKWLQHGVVEWNKTSIQLENGSRVLASATSASAVRGGSYNVIFMDEFAHVPANIADEFFSSVYPTITSGQTTKVIIVSTPNGLNMFYNLWQGASRKAGEEGKNEYVPVEVHWSQVPLYPGGPLRDEKWKQRTIKQLGGGSGGEQKFKSEYDCDFIGSGDTVIDPALLTWYKETYVMEPVEKRGFDGNLWVWEHPNYNRQYMVSADVARGDGADFSTVQVIDIEDSSQVAEYKGKIETKDFGNFLVSLATEYNNALLVVENSNVGWATIQQIINRGYGNLFYMSNDLKYIDTERQMSNKFYRDEKQMVAGFSTTSKTRPLIISALDTYMKDKDILIRSSRLIDELFTFIWNGGKAEAMRGYNDDLTMALGIGLWVRNTALRLRQEGIDLTKSMLNSTTIQNDTGVYAANWQNQRNPYEMQIGKGEVENLTWLLK